MTMPILLGTSHFPNLRRAGGLYVDKSGFIVEVLADPGETVLLPRPRRFGKTLNLSMLETFLARGPEEVRPLFAGLAIEQEGEEVWTHFQRYPVLSLTFKDVKATSWENASSRLNRIVRELAESARSLLDLGALTPAQRKELALLISGRAPQELVESSLRLLSSWLHVATGERAVILVDEYDTPIHAGVEHGYYDEVVSFVRNLLSGGLKDNASLFKGVLTGILRVAKESLFSGLNNLSVYSLLHRRFRDAFGFKPEEVGELAGQLGIETHLDTMREWYDGYRFGGQVVYNPWSVMSFAANVEAGPQPYWVNTAWVQL